MKPRVFIWRRRGTWLLFQALFVVVILSLINTTTWFDLYDWFASFLQQREYRGYITLATNNKYALCALVLLQSLKDTGSLPPISMDTVFNSNIRTDFIVLVTHDHTISKTLLRMLKEHGATMLYTQTIDFGGYGDAENATTTIATTSSSPLNNQTTTTVALATTSAPLDRIRQQATFFEETLARLTTRPERGHRWWTAFTKLHAFSMVQYKTLVWIDSDALVMRDIKELFDLQSGN